MKYFLIFLSIILISCQTTEKVEKDGKKDKKIEKKVVKTDREVIFETIPKNIDMFFLFSSIEEVYKHLDIKRDGDGILAFTERFSKYDIGELEKITKLDFSKPKEYKKFGIDTNRPAGVTITDMAARGISFIWFIPIFDQKLLFDKITEMFKNEKSVDVERENNTLKLSIDKKDKIYLISKNSYLFVIISPDKDPVKLFNMIKNPDGSLSDDPNFKKVLKKFDIKKDLFGYLTLKNMISSKMLEVMINESWEGFNLVNSFEHLSFIVDVSGSDLIIDGTFSFKKDSEMGLFLNEDFTIDRDSILSTKEKPFFIASTTLNFNKIYGMFLKLLSEYEKKDIKMFNQTLKAAFNIDYEKDILENLGNNISFAAYDAKNFNLNSLNLLFTVSILNREGIINSIDKVLMQMPKDYIKKYDEKDFLKFDISVPPFIKAYSAVTKDQIIFSFKEDYFNSAISKKYGWINDIEDKNFKNILKTGLSIFYLDFKELITFLSNLKSVASLSNQEIKVLESFKDLFMARVTKDSYKIVLKTNFKDIFFVGLKNLIKEVD